jgi:hypothetical protein
MLQVVRKCSEEPRGELVYILISAEYKLNINFREDEILRNSSSMYSPTEFRVIF